MKTDILIIGGGIIGTAIAREISKYNLNITLVEKGADIANETTKANSGIIHGGYNSSQNSLKGKLNVKSNPKFDKICKDLKVPFSRIGSLVVGFDDNDLKILKAKKENGNKMGIKNLKILTKNELIKKEPQINKKAKYALYAPTAGIISPFKLAIAYADNAVINGVNILLNTEVNDIRVKNNQIKSVKTNNKNIKADLVINAAGLFADKIAQMAGDYSFEIFPRKGEYHLFDKKYGDLVNHVLFPVPAEKSKGILITPTVHQNLLIGPNSDKIKDKSNISTTNEGLQEVVNGAKKLIPTLPEDGVITSFAGLRAVASGEEFIIDFSKKTKGLINVAGIQSPGLSSTPKIAEKVVNMIVSYYKKETNDLHPKDDFINILPKKLRFRDYENNEDKWQSIINKNKDYGEIVCRCESVTKGEILMAINRPVPAKTIDAIKRRTRAGMGRCQGGFCGPRVVNILAEELGVSPLDITKKGGNSYVLKARAKELIKGS